MALFDFVTNKFRKAKDDLVNSRFNLAEQTRSAIALARPAIRQGVNRVSTRLRQDPASFSLANQLATRKISSGFKPLDTAGQIAGAYVQNRMVKPAFQAPQNFAKALNPRNKLTPLQRGGQFLQGGLNTLQAAPIPVLQAGNLAFGAYEYAKGVRSSDLQGGQFLQNQQAGLKAFTGEKPVGLGEAITTNPTGQVIGNLAELPLILAGTRKLSKPRLKSDELNIIKRTIQNARNWQNLKSGQQISAFMDLESVASKYIPKIYRSKELQKLQKYNPDEYRNTLIKFLDDRVFNPDIAIGFQAKNIRGKLDDAKGRIDDVKQELSPLIKGRGKVAPEDLIPLGDVTPPGSLRGRGNIKLSPEQQLAPQSARFPQGQTGQLTKKGQSQLSQKIPVRKSSENILPQPREQLLLPGKYSAKTPAEAKRLFKKTGYVPEFDFQLKSNRKTPIVTPGKSTFYSAEPQAKILTKQAVEKQKKLAQQEFAEYQKGLDASFGKRTTTGAVNDLTKSIKTNTKGAPADPTGLKDISSPATQFKDIFRNFKTVYGKKYDQVKEQILDPLFVKGKRDLLNDQQNWVKKISNEVEEGFGIKKGSQESADVQKFGEKLITEADLVKKYGAEKANKLVQADKWFRKNYDQLLDEVNAVRAKIYPNNPDKIIPKRQDYYRHFQELSRGIDGLLNTFTQAVDVSPGLAGKSYQTQPKSKWLSFAQRRLGNKTEYDAVGGFIDYVKAQTYAKHVDPHIGRFRALSDELAEATAEKGGLNNFILHLNRFADDLSGKTNPADRFLQELGGRRAFAVINWLNQRTKANVILGNASSALAQPFNLQNGIAEAGPRFAIKGIAKSLGSMFAKSKPMNESVFLKERYFRAFDKFDRGMINNSRKFAAWMITALDEVSTKAIWNMQYEKAIAKGIKNPINYADDITRKMVGGRGIGEMPLIQRSKAFQMVAPFQLEVTNAWHVIGDMVGEKAFGKLATLFVASYVMNRAVKEVRGSDVSFDPINATIEGIQAFNEEEDKKVGALKLGGRLGGEVLSNAPLGQTVAGVYPEFGFKVGETQLPTRKEFFGEGDPTRFGGTGLPGVIGGGLQDPLFKLIPSFGGQQLKRSYEGLKGFKEGVSTTPTGRIRFKVEQTPGNLLKNAVFGQYSTDAGQKYIQGLGKSKSEIIYNDFKKLKTNEERAALWDQYVKEGKITKENVSDIKKQFLDKKSKIESKEKSIRSLPVADGSRTRMILKEFNKLDTPKEKAELWDRYVELGIITKEVAKQLKAQL